METNWIVRRYHYACHSQTPELVQLTLSDKELSSKQIGSHNLQKAIEALHRDGIVAISNAVDHAHIDKLNVCMVEEAQVLYDNPKTHRNFGSRTDNFQQEPVNDPEYLFEGIIANPWATSITECMLGPNPNVRFYSANTALKADGRQPPHIDVDFDFQRFLSDPVSTHISLIFFPPTNR